MDGWTVWNSLLSIHRLPVVTPVVCARSIFSRCVPVYCWFCAYFLLSVHHVPSMLHCTASCHHAALPLPSMGGLPTLPPPPRLMACFRVPSCMPPLPLPFCKRACCNLMLFHFSFTLCAYPYRQLLTTPAIHILHAAPSSRAPYLLTLFCYILNTCLLIHMPHFSHYYTHLLFARLAGGKGRGSPSLPKACLLLPLLTSLRAFSISLTHTCLGDGLSSINPWETFLWHLHERLIQAPYVKKT